MKRRDFLANAGAATAAVVSTGGASLRNHPADATVAHARRDDPFVLDYAPHFGMFKESAGDDLIDQVAYMADRGFRSMEDNGMKGRPLEVQEAIAAEMQKRNMRMGVFVAHQIYWREPNLARGEKEKHEEFLADIESSVAVAKRVNAKWMTVVPGHLDLRLDRGYQTANVVDVLRRACGILEPHGLVMVLEPLNPRNHPGLFLAKAAHAFEICRAVDSPSCKILFDIYHQQITEGNLIPNIERCWDEIGYFQIGDNPGRNEPTSGEIHYGNVFKYIRERGFDGILGMEHGNSQKGAAGEERVIAAYREVDPV